MDFVCAPLMCLISLLLCANVFLQKRQVILETGKSNFSGETVDGAEVTDDGGEVTDDGVVTDDEGVAEERVVTDNGEVTDVGDVVELVTDERRLVRRGL